jgi:hypothetical protein
MPRKTSKKGGRSKKGKGGRSKGPMQKLEFIHGKKRVLLKKDRDIDSLRVVKMSNGAWRLYGTYGDINVSKFVSKEVAQKWRR